MFMVFGPRDVNDVFWRVLLIKSTMHDGCVHWCMHLILRGLRALLVLVLVLVWRGGVVGCEPGGWQGGAHRAAGSAGAAAAQTPRRSLRAAPRAPRPSPWPAPPAPDGRSARPAPTRRRPAARSAGWGRPCAPAVVVALTWVRAVKRDEGLIGRHHK